MLPRRLALLLALPFAAVVLSSYHYRSSLRDAAAAAADPHSPPHFVATPSSSVAAANFTFIVKVLTFDRIESLRRCLRSLAAPDYDGDRVALHVYVDHFPGVGEPLDQKLNESRRILEFLDGFHWIHGEKMAHYRTGNAGLQAQWLEAWWPGSDDEFVFVVEDDVVVSPLFYRFLKKLILRYFYDPANYNPSIYGASLQRPRFVAGKHGNKLQIGSETRLFLYQMVGTWGQLLFPKPWKEFRLWYDEHKAKGWKPLLKGMVTTGWYKKMGDRIWTPWFIKFIHSRGYYNLYTNFMNDTALSVSHRDAGVNYGRSAGPDSYLLDQQPLDFDLWDMQPLKNLKWYDFCFSEVLPGRLVMSQEQFRLVLGSLRNRKTVMLVTLCKAPSWRISRNFLCHLKKLGVPNLVIVADDSEYVLDLARRGYIAIDVNRFQLPPSRSGCEGLASSGAESVKEFLVLANVLKQCLEFGYSSWVAGWNIIPVGNSLPELGSLPHDFMAAQNADLMFVKSSPSSSAFLNGDFACTMATLANRSPASWQSVHLLFSKALEGKVHVERKMFEESFPGSKLGSNSSIALGRRLVFWSRQLDSSSVEEELTRANLWSIDNDSSCDAVTCHGALN